MKKLFLTTIIWISALLLLKSQDLSNYNLYMQNYYLFNPAYTFNSTCYNVYLNTHQQWLGLEGAPKSYNLGFYGPVFNNSGAGITIDRRQSGLLNNYNVLLNYSYRAYFADQHFIAFGISMGVMGDIINKNLINQNYANDPSLTADVNNKYFFTTNFGLGYQYKNFEFQYIAPQFLQRNKINIHSVSILAYNYTIDDRFKLKPSILARWAKISPSQAEANILLDYKDFVWVQIGYRTSKSIISSVGVKFKGVNIGYAYQADFGKLAATNSGTHEIQLIYNFGEHICNKKSEKLLLNGQIIDAYTSKGIDNAEISFYNDKGVEIYKTKTSQNGTYQIPNLLPNQGYRMKIVKDNFETKDELITLNPTETTTTKDISMVPIKGKINLYGLPSKAKVIVVDNNGNTVYSGNADENGNCQFVGEYKKNYKITVTADGYESKTTNLEFIKGSENLKINLLEYKNLKAKFINRDTKEPLKVQVTIRDNSKVVFSNEVVGECSVALLPGKYTIEVYSQEIVPMKQSIEISSEQPKEQSISIEPKTLSKNKTFELGVVSFETGKSIIKPESFTVLDELVKIMNDNPQMKIEIQGHTDNVGNPTTNLKLSQQRANACKDYVVGKGISADRLTAVGYGQTKPLVPNTTPENRTKNRRTEFKILD